MLNDLQEDRTPSQSYELIKEIMTKECNGYLQKLLQKDLEILLPYEENITNNKLVTPYKDYLQADDLLESLMKLFMLYDASFPSSSLKRLHRTIQKFRSVFRSFQKRNASTLVHFEKFVEHHSELFVHLNQLINRFKKKHLASKNIQKEIALLEKDKKALRYFYFENFSHKYLHQKQVLEKRYKKVLNSYLFHFDLLLWDDAKSSTKIVQRLLETGFEELSTGEYIKHRLSLSLPYSIEYQKLKKIYRNYK